VVVTKPKKPTNTSNHEILKAAFLQGGEREATELFNDLIRSAVREAFWEMMAREVEVLCGASKHTSWLNTARSPSRPVHTLRSHSAGSAEQNYPSRRRTGFSMIRFRFSERGLRAPTAVEKDRANGLSGAKEVFRTVLKKRMPNTPIAMS